VLAAGAFVLRLSRDPITRKNFDRIQERMTRIEVEAILGPPGINRAVLDRLNRENFDDAAYPGAWDDYPLFEDDPDCGLWIGDAGMIAINFRDGRAGAKGWAPRTPLLQRLYGWFDRWFPDL
jgi:hypothetical protein